MWARFWKPILGWASAGLGIQIGEMLDKIRFEGKDGARADGNGELRKFLKKSYGDRDYAERLEAMKDTDLSNLAETLRIGVPMATPVFDGAREDEIVDLLRQGRAARLRPGCPDRRPNGRSVRPTSHGRLHLYVEAAPSWSTTRSMPAPSVLTAW